MTTSDGREAQPARPSEPVAPEPKPERVGEECWFAHLDAITDIWWDGQFNEPDARCYVPGALKDAMMGAITAINANREYLAPHPEPVAPTPALVHPTESDSTAVQRPVGEGHWRSVDEDGYPERETECLVWVDNGAKWGPHAAITDWSMQRESPVSWSSATIETGYGWDGFYENEVTHWMPLPEPPPAASGSSSKALDSDEQRSNP